MLFSQLSLPIMGMFTVIFKGVSGFDFSCEPFDRIKTVLESHNDGDSDLDKKYTSVYGVTYLEPMFVDEYADSSVNENESESFYGGDTNFTDEDLAKFAQEFASKLGVSEATGYNWTQNLDLNFINKREATWAFTVFPCTHMKVKQIRGYCGNHYVYVSTLLRINYDSNGNSMS